MRTPFCDRAGAGLETGLVARNVATLVDPPSRDGHELRPLTADEVAVLLSAIKGDRLRALYVTAIGLGLRQGELLALQWRDISVDAGTVTVRHTPPAR